MGREEAVIRHFELEMERRAPPRRQLYLASTGFGVGTGFVLLVSAVVMVRESFRSLLLFFELSRWLSGLGYLRLFAAGNHPRRTYNGSRGNHSGRLFLDQSFLVRRTTAVKS